jgi:hypothetical protein
MLVQNHFAEPNCNVFNFCWFDITFAGPLTTCGASTLTSATNKMWCGLWHALTTRFQDSNTLTWSPYPWLTTLTWLTKPTPSPGLTTPKPSPGAKSPNPILCFQPCLVLSAGNCHLLTIVTSAHENKPFLRPCPPFLTGKATPILPRELPFSSPCNATSNLRGHHYPRS